MGIYLGAVVFLLLTGLLATMTVTTVVAARHLRHRHTLEPAGAPKAAKKAADERAWRDPASAGGDPLATVCPVCGMEDAERFALKVGVATWHGWPAHAACVEWLEGPGYEDKAPEPSAVAAWGVALASRTMSVNETRETVATSAMPGEYALSIQFPRITRQQIAYARGVQRDGFPILVGDLEPGDTKACLYGAPDYGLVSLLADDEALYVRGGGALDGGFTMFLLLSAVRKPHRGGTLVTPG